MKLNVSSLPTTQQLLIGSVLAGLITSAILLRWTNPIEALRISFGILLVFFYPGFAWFTYFWQRETASRLYTATLSVALSLAISPITIYVSSKIGVPIHSLSVFIELLIVTLIGFIFTQTKHTHPKHTNKTPQT